MGPVHVGFQSGLVRDVVSEHGDVVITGVDGLGQVGSHVVVKRNRGGTNESLLLKFGEYFLQWLVVHHLRHGDAVGTMQHVEMVGLQALQ